MRTTEAQGKKLLHRQKQTQSGPTNRSAMPTSPENIGAMLSEILSFSITGSCPTRPTWCRIIPVYLQADTLNNKVKENETKTNQTQWLDTSRIMGDIYNIKNTIRYKISQQNHGSTTRLHCTKPQHKP